MSGTRVVLRPLLGISRSGARQGIPPGTFWDVENWTARTSGLTTPKGWRYAGRVSESTTVGGYVHDFEALYGANVAFQGALTSKSLLGQTVSLLIYRHFVHEIAHGSTGSFTVTNVDFPSTLSYTSAVTASSTGTVITVTGSGTTFVTDGVVNGAAVTIVEGADTHQGFVDTASGTLGETTIPIRVVTAPSPALSADTISLYVHGSFDHGTTFDLGGENVGNIDWAAYHSGVVFADGENGLWNYDGSDISQLDSDTTVTGVKAVAFHDGRLWAYDLEDSGTHYPYRIRWTTQADLTTFPSANFQDIPFSRTEGLRLVGLNNLMVAFTSSEVFIGTPTNMIGLPYSFAPFDTGGIGLAGKRALLLWRDGVVFVGQDDLYYLGGGSSFESFGSDFVAQYVRTCVDAGQGYRIRMGWDAIDDRISVFLPQTTDDASTYLDFPIASKQWTKRVLTSVLSFQGFGWLMSTSPQRWTDASTAWDEMDELVAWEDVTSTTGHARQYAFMLGQEGHNVYTQMSAPYEFARPLFAALLGGGLADGTFLETLGGGDADTEYTGETFGGGGVWAPYSVVPHTRVLTSGAIDCGTPDQRKLFNRLAIRLGEQAPSDVDFTLRVKGSSRAEWVTIGHTATISAGDYATRFSFREFGSTLEFELTTSTQTTVPFDLVELILDYHPAGSQVRY